MVRIRPFLTLLTLCLVLASLHAVSASAARAPAPRAAVLDANGTWQEHGTLADQFYPTWYDPAGDRLVTLGDWDPGARELPLGGAPQWRGLPGLPSNVSADYGNTAWDTETGEAYVLSFDGVAQTLWHITPGLGVSATPVAASGTPPSPRIYSIVRFDHATQRLFVMGGSDPVTYSGYPALFVLQLGPSPAWSSPAVPGRILPIYTSMQLDVVVDPLRHRLVLFDSAVPDSVWTLSIDSPTAWSALPVSVTSGSGPYAVTNAGLVVDPDGDRVLAVDMAGQAWSFSLGAAVWTPITPSGPSPPVHRYASLGLDRARHRLLMNGGRATAPFTPSSDLWALSLDGLPAWTQLLYDAPRPSSRTYETVGYDPTRNRIVMFGGQGLYWPAQTPITDFAWSLDLSSTPTWSPLVTAGSPPTSTSFVYSTVYDPVRDQLLCFGAGASVMTLSFAGSTPTWGTLTPPGVGPSSRSGASAIYDSGRDRFLFLFGNASGFALLSEVWELRLSPVLAWRQLAPAGTPPDGRVGALAAYDPAGDRVIAFGGVSLPDTFSTSTWSLDLASGDGTWSRLAIPDGPAGRRGGMLCLDPARSRLVLFGGWGRATSLPLGYRFEPQADSWALDLSPVPSWRALAPQGAPPTSNDSPGGAYDVANDRLVLTGSTRSWMVDTWTLSFGGQPTATEVSLEARDVASDHVTLVWAGGTPGSAATAYRRTVDPAWQSLGTLACDGLGRFTLTDRDVTPGTQAEYRLGISSGGTERFFGATTIDVPALALALRAGLTADHGVQLTLQLPAAGSARLSLYDVTGRRVWRRNVDVTASGTQTVAVDGAGLRTGLYFADMRWGREGRHARVTLIR